MASNEKNDSTKDASENTPTEAANGSKQRKTALGTIIKDVTRQGTGIGIVGVAQLPKNEKPN
jgi:hypothetical protein